MSTTFNEIKSITVRLLNDTPTLANGEISGGQYNADLLYDATKAAMTAITTRVWKAATVTLAGSSGSALLPVNFIEIEGVLDLYAGKWLPESSIVPLEFWDEERITGNAWIQYPEGSISFVTDLPEDGAVLYYTAEWDMPTSGSDLMDTPDYANFAISLFAASYCAITKAVTAADLGQYKVKVDSGRPTDNPLIDLSNFLLARYGVELERLPMKKKGTH